MVPGAYWQREDLAAALRGRGCQQVVLTAGAAGCIIADAEGMVRVPAVAAEVADVTGAGDALVAGTLAGLTHGLPLRSAVTLGTSLAARTVARAESVAPDLSPALLTQLIAALPPRTL
jgi:pseudouridine kinase